jgi:hypothetical protein
MSSKPSQLGAAAGPAVTPSLESNSVSGPSTSLSAPLASAEAPSIPTSVPSAVSAADHQIGEISDVPIAAPVHAGETSSPSAISGLPSTAPARTLEPSKFLHFGGDKHWLLIKEGIHIMLDRILIKDAAHLLTKCPLYGRLSRLEKRALVLKFATALVQRQPIIRNVLVDTIFLCAHEACEAEAKLEAPPPADKRGKARVPFMQKVLGEAYFEYYGYSDLSDPVAVEAEERGRNLVLQKAAAQTVVETMTKLKTLSLSAPVVSYFSGLAEGGLGRTPAVIYNRDIASVFGMDYFLPPVPTFTVEDEKHLLECIRRDEEDAGKETVFAANLKKAMKLIRQGRVKTEFGDLDISADATALLAAGSPGARVDSLWTPSDGTPTSKSATTAAEPVTKDTGHYLLPSSNLPSGASFFRACDVKADSHKAEGSKKKSVDTPAYTDWWRDLRWINKFCRSGLSSMLNEFFNADRGLLQSWTSSKEIQEADKLKIFSLNAEETCEVIDHQPLWLSLRGMVGSNLFADGMWPITSNDGHLTIVRFRRNDRNRFWFIDKGGMDASTLAGVFLAWLRTMRTSLRDEVGELGNALAANNVEEVSRCIQRHLEAGVVSFMVLKAVSFAIEREAAKAADMLGDLLVLEEERMASQASKKKDKKKKGQGVKPDTEPGASNSAPTQTPPAGSTSHPSSPALKPTEPEEEPLSVDTGALASRVESTVDDDGWEVSKPRKHVGPTPAVVASPAQKPKTLREVERTPVKRVPTKQQPPPAAGILSKAALPVAEPAERRVANGVSKMLPSSPMQVPPPRQASSGARSMEPTVILHNTVPFSPVKASADLHPSDLQPRSQNFVASRLESAPAPRVDIRPAPVGLPEPVALPTVAESLHPSKDIAEAAHLADIGIIRDIFGGSLDASPPRSFGGRMQAPASDPSYGAPAWQLPRESSAPVPQLDSGLWRSDVPNNTEILRGTTGAIWGGGLGLLPTMQAASTAPGPLEGLHDGLGGPTNSSLSNLSAAAPAFVATNHGPAQGHAFDMLAPFSFGSMASAAPSSDAASVPTGLPYLAGDVMSGYNMAIGRRAESALPSAFPGSSAPFLMPPSAATSVFGSGTPFGYPQIPAGTWPGAQQPSHTLSSSGENSTTGAIPALEHLLHQTNAWRMP